VESFTIYDEEQVRVELVSAHLTVTQSHDIAEYVRAFTELSGIAVYGAAARALIAAATESFA
jgi:UDP-galactopyranose mutase